MLAQPPAQHLRDSNERLHRRIEGLAAELSLPHPHPARPQEIDALLSELRSNGAWLRTLPPPREPELEEELSTYRQLIERLRDLLPAVQATLLEERARIERERSRVASALEWARRSRETL